MSIFHSKTSDFFLLRTQISTWNKSEVEIGFFFFSQNPIFDFSLQEIWFFSSQNPNSTSHSRSQVKIGFPLLKFRLFTPRNLIFFSFLLQEIEKSSQNRIFLLLRTQTSIFFFSEPKVKIGFILLKCRLFTPRNLIFSAFHSKKSKSQVKMLNDNSYNYIR